MTGDCAKSLADGRRFNRPINHHLSRTFCALVQLSVSGVEITLSRSNDVLLAAQEIGSRRTRGACARFDPDLHRRDRKRGFPCRAATGSGGQAFRRGITTCGFPADEQAKGIVQLWVHFRGPPEPDHDRLLFQDRWWSGLTRNGLRGTGVNRNPLWAKGEHVVKFCVQRIRVYNPAMPSLLGVLKILLRKRSSWLWVRHKGFRSRSAEGKWAGCG